MKTSSRAFPIARAFIALVFIVSGIAKVTNFHGTEAFMAAKGMPLVGPLLVLAIAIELVCGGLIVIGYMTDAAAILLFLYLIPVTLVFHKFWGIEGPEAQTQLVNFLKNLGLMGGLLVLAVASPTSVSLDERLGRSAKSTPTPTPV